MSTDKNRWGIIYCPKEGKTGSQKHWMAIRKYLKEKGIHYDFVQSEDKESVERLAAMLAGNGYTTLVVVGGDAALYRALNGLMTVDADRLSQIALGVIPYGWANDFARFWGLSEDDYKKALEYYNKVKSIDSNFNNVKYYEEYCLDKINYNERI